MSGTITHEWNGTVLTVTSDSGTSSCDLKGEKGDTGIRGPQGATGEQYKPVYGVDYFTEEEKAETIAQVKDGIDYDTTLTQENIGAEAKAVGEAIATIQEQFNEKAPIAHYHSADDIISGCISLDKGGTGSLDLVDAPNNAIIKKADNDFNELYYTPTTNGAFYATKENGYPKFGILPIAQGGTGATTAEEARANLNAIRIDLLWTNASPTSEFASQTLSLGLGSYSAYIVIARQSTTASNSVSVVQKTVANSRLINFSYSSSIELYSRAVDYISGGSLKFYDGWKNSSKDNSILIPMYVYGIKGVKY